MNNLKNDQAESYIIGYLLSNKNTILLAMEYITEKDFSNNNYQMIFRCIYDLYLANKEPELITISEILKPSIPMIYTVLVDAMESDSYVTEKSFIDCLEQVKKCSLLRNINHWLYKGYERTQSLNLEDIDSYILNLIDESFQYTEKLKKKKNPDHKEILSEITSDIDKDYVKNIAVTGRLGEVVPGLFPGHLILLGGYTSTGKSFFLNQMIIDIYQNNGKVLLFSLEDSRKEKLIKIISNLSNIHQTEIITNAVAKKPDDIKIISEIMGNISPWEFYIYDDVYNLQEIKMKIKKHKLQNDIDIVCIDFIQNIKEPGSIYEKMSKIALELQMIAKELQVTIIALSQVSNEGMSNPDIIGLKGAGEIAAAADIILWLRRFKEPNLQNVLDCEIRKNRPFGKTGTIAYKFSPNWSSLNSMSKEEREYLEEPANKKIPGKDFYNY